MKSDAKTSVPTNTGGVDGVKRVGFTGRRRVQHRNRVASVGCASLAHNHELKAESGVKYRVYYKDQLPEATWTPLGELLIGTGGILNYTNTIDGVTQRFYRVHVEPQ